MEEIYDAVDTFPFDKLVLTKPTAVPGGNYFSRCLINNAPLYIQPPKCKTKQGILKAGKRFYTDLMFTNENEALIRWMENLENHCQQYIFKNRERWFDGDLELHDVENYFTSPLKIYKSGKYYIARTNISSTLGKPSLKIYDENENELDFESINDKTNVMTIIEIQGIKCSARSFQIEIELKQMMVLKPSNLFEKCIIKPKTDISVAKADLLEEVVRPTVESLSLPPSKIEVNHGTTSPEPEPEPEPDASILEESLEKPISLENDTVTDCHVDTNDMDGSYNSDSEGDSDNEDEPLPPIKIVDGMEEIEFHLDELPQDTNIQLKKRDDVYYEMYREARKKARIARDLALASYLEAKRIKNTYMLEDFDDSEDDDGEDESVLDKLQENENDDDE